MALTAGSRLGPYEVVSPLGAGGMGEVYRARDERLRRDVAIKVLPASVADDEERLRRFEQEALATAALNHPNILVVFDIGRQADTTYVVEELLEGRTLREVLDAGPLPVRKAMDYAAQIAQGLAAAHGKGLVHRDLKPENLFVTDDDRVKILDFGLAKVVDATASSGATSTVLSPGTEPGMVLGTIGYMAPEQVRGVAVDHRADIFSFGAVLYELLTGQRAFRGDTAADTMTAILKEPPPELSSDDRPIPAALARVVERCLEKQPAARFQSASDLAFALQALGSDARSGSGSTPALADAPRDTRASGWGPLAAAVVAGAVIASGLWLALSPVPELPTEGTLDIAAPAGQTLSASAALSPDGLRLAFEARDEDGVEHLWIRELDSGATRVVTVTDGGANPFWSPDGTEIGFFGDQRLQAVDLTNDRVRVICDAPGSRTYGTWSQHGVIVFSTENGDPLKQVSADERSAPVSIANAVGFRPHFLPDGRHVLFGAWGQGLSGGIQVLDLESAEVRALLPAGTGPTYAAGHVLFVLDQEIVAQPFDADTLQPSGSPQTLTPIGGPRGGPQGHSYTVAGGRFLIFVGVSPEAGADRETAWYTRDGVRERIASASAWSNPELSPDDELFVGVRQAGTDLALYDVRQGRERRIASGITRPIFSAGWFDERSVWVKYGGEASVDIVSIDGAEERTIPSLSNLWMTEVRADLHLGFSIRQGSRDILFVNPPDTSERAFASTPLNETQPALSPDGRWLAYVSYAVGTNLDAPDNSDIFIQPFPEGGPPISASEGAPGVQPQWRADGRELFYLGADSRMMAVSVTPVGNEIRVGPPVALFQTAMAPQGGLGTRAHYDVTRDGSRFIVTEGGSVEDATRRPESYTVLVDWVSRLR